MTISKSTCTKIKLPGGHTLMSNDPFDELNKNRRHRLAALFQMIDGDDPVTRAQRRIQRNNNREAIDSDFPDEIRAQHVGIELEELERFDHLIERTARKLYMVDAKARIEGVIDPRERAARMHMCMDEYKGFQRKLKKLEKKVWKKHADFFEDMLASHLFKQTLFLRQGGLFHQGKKQGPVSIQDSVGMSSATYYRRRESGCTYDELFKKPRHKSPAAMLTHDGLDYRPVAFANAFGISLAQVRKGISYGWNAGEILRAAELRRKRPILVLNKRDDD